MFSRFLLAAAIAFVAQICAAQEPTPNKNTQPQIRDLGDGMFQVGDVTLDKNARSVTFPATVNMSDGVIEYLLVSKFGKTHESMFATDVEPFHLHTAMLLLGARGTPSSSGVLEPVGQITNAGLEHAPALKGENVFIFVKWKTAGGDRRVNAEDLVFNDKTKRNAARGPWTYNGSGFYAQGKFAAQIEGSFVAMVTDPTALINNPRPGRDNDSIWSVDPAKVPPKDTPVQITIQLENVKP